MECDDAGKPFIHLPVEVWLEIFKKVDTPQLYALTLVCKHWNRIIVHHFSKKFILHLNSDQCFRLDQGFRLGQIGVLSERRYKHLTIQRSFKLTENCSYSSALLLEAAQHMAGSLESLHLHFDTDDISHFSGPIPVLPTVRQLSLHGANFEEAVFLAFPNVRELDMDVTNARHLEMLEWMAPRLKVLKLTVQYTEMNNVWRIQLPALKTMKLTIYDPDDDESAVLQTEAFGAFLRNCSMLKTAKISILVNSDQRLLPVIYTNLPLVETLKLFLCFFECISLNELDQMKRLKNFELYDELGMHSEELWVVQENNCVVPTVETFSVGCYKFNDFLKRFPNLKSLFICLYALTYLTSDVINYMKQLTGLQKIEIRAFIHEDDIALLSDIIVFPNLKQLEIYSNAPFSHIVPDVVRTVALKNIACKLIWIGKLVTVA